jgi:hypothetical protein
MPRKVKTNGPPGKKKIEALVKNKPREEKN